jgi:hypothetical protein
MKTEYIVEAIGIAGAIEVLLAYGLNSYQKIKSDSWLFIILNLTGGVLLIVYSVYKEAWANMYINIFWVIIAVIAIAKHLNKRRSLGQSNP